MLQSKDDENNGAKFYIIDVRFNLSSHCWYFHSFTLNTNLEFKLLCL